MDTKELNSLFDKIIIVIFIFIFIYNNRDSFLDMYACELLLKKKKTTKDLGLAGLVCSLTASCVSSFERDNNLCS